MCLGHGQDIRRSTEQNTAVKILEAIASRLIHRRGRPYRPGRSKGMLEPVNGLARPARQAACRAAQSGLATRIAQYQPKAIVSLLIGIGDIVEAAAIEAGSYAVRYVVPFPVMVQQARFRAAMAKIVPLLPRT